jgi:DNA-binding GntR family transcriptional regulator
MSQPRYRELVAYIKQQIESGVYRPGDQIPSTAELRTQFDCSATVVNQAVLLLANSGLIEGVPGVGRFVKE